MKIKKILFVILSALVFAVMLAVLELNMLIENRKERSQLNGS